MQTNFGTRKGGDEFFNLQRKRERERHKKAKHLCNQFLKYNPQLPLQMKEKEKKRKFLIKEKGERKKLTSFSPELLFKSFLSNYSNLTFTDRSTREEKV